jgi:hypothetical protein
MSSDHDLLIKISTDVGYIKKTLEAHCNQIIELEKKTNTCEDWRSGWDQKSKFITGVAVFVGGALVWIGDKLFNWFSRK